MTETFRKGSRVKWNWGQGVGRGRIAERFATEGWHVSTVDGRDHDALEKALSERGVGVPNAVVATVLDPAQDSGRRAEEVAA